MRAPNDTGSVTIALTAGLGGMALVLLSLLLAAGTGTYTSDTATCQYQPPPTSQAATAIPAAYLALYRSAGQTYGIAWNLLAGIGKVESDHGQSTLPGVHSGANAAGAMGPMQFITSTWAEYGDGGDVYNPADAIPAAARYLRASGAPGNVSAAVFAYNHSTAYVTTVETWANRYATNGTNAITTDQNPACEQAAIGTPPAGTAGKVIAFAEAQLGKPYVYGGTGPDSYDCSGLTMMAYRAAGITIPRTADTQYNQTPHIPASSAQPGDLVFFVPGTTGPGHVGIILNPTQHTMIAAPHTGTVVKIQNWQAVAAADGLVGFSRPR